MVPVSRMHLCLLVDGHGAWPLEQSGMVKTGVVTVVAIVFQYQSGSGQRGLYFAVKKVEYGTI